MKEKHVKMKKSYNDKIFDIIKALSWPFFFSVFDFLNCLNPLINGL